MNWIQGALYTTNSGIDPVTGLLLQLGINGFEIEDGADFKEFLEATTPHWDYVEEGLLSRLSAETCVKFYLADNAQGAETKALVMAELPRISAADPEKHFGRLEVIWKTVCEEDWSETWKQYYKPFSVGKKLLIRPTWEQAENPESRLVLTIDPGSSFGTGQHQTTRLCLECVEHVIDPGHRVLDLGAGSGILSIAALLLGAQSAVAVDIDENAVRIAKENAALNGFVPPVFDAITGNVAESYALRVCLSEKRFDLIMANIVADVLIAHAPYFDALAAPGGKLVVSGILSERKEAVVREIERHRFRVVSDMEDGGWAAVVLSSTR